MLLWWDSVPAGGTEANLGGFNPLSSRSYNWFFLGGGWNNPQWNPVIFGVEIIHIFFSNSLTSQVSSSIPLYFWEGRNVMQIIVGFEWFARKKKAFVGVGTISGSLMFRNPSLNFCHVILPKTIMFSKVTQNICTWPFKQVIYTSIDFAKTNYMVFFSQKSHVSRVF